MMKDYNVKELSNGLTLVHRQTQYGKIAHCAIMLDIGSRDEKPDQQGLAHFWEHMAFKGTEKRKAFHIINRLESVGGELNAYTTKEKICFYASVLEQHIEKAVDLISDITFHSVFPQAQIVKERHVILEEMAMYRDAPEDAIQDEMDTLIYKGHQLGNNILGEPESVMAFNQEDFHQFIAQNLNTSKAVLSSVGPLPFNKMVRLFEKFLGEIPAKDAGHNRQAPSPHIAQKVKAKKDLSQSHVGLGRHAFSIHDQEKIAFQLLNNILGGHSMNSRLNLALRENNGFVYNIESNFHTMTDTGFFTIFYATEPVNYLRSIKLIDREFAKLKNKKMGVNQLHSAKEQLKGQIAMALENNQNVMLRMARHQLDFGRVDPVGDYFSHIDAVSADQLLSLANEYLNMDDMSMLTYSA